MFLTKMGRDKQKLNFLFQFLWPDRGNIHDMCAYFLLPTLYCQKIITFNRRYSSLIVSIISVIFFFLIPFTAWGQNSYHMRYWKAKDGLAESFSRTIGMGPSKKLWINHGNISHMSVLNGFRLYHIPSPGPEVPVYENSVGHVWSIYPDGLQQYINGKWIQHSIDEIRTIVPFYPIGSNHVVFLLPHFIYAFNTSTRQTSILKRVDETNLGSFSDLAPTLNGGLWIIAEHGIAKLQFQEDPSVLKSVWEECDTTDRRFKYLQNPVVGNDGELYVVGISSHTSMHKLLCYDGIEWRTIYSSDERIERGWCGIDGIVWIQKSNSLISVHTNKGHYSEEINHYTGSIYDVQMDKNGIFWMATSHGVIRFAPCAWRREIGLSGIDTTVHSIYEDSMRRLWAISRNHLLLLQNEDWILYPLPDNYHAHRFETDALQQLSDGRILMNCSHPSHLLAFDPEEEKFDFIRHPSGRSLRFMAPSKKDGNIYVRTEGGNQDDFRLEIYTGEKFQKVFDLRNEWNIGRIRHLLEMEDGTLWIGGLNSVGFYDNGIYNTANSEKGYTGTGAFYIHAIGKEKVWIGERNNVFEYDGDSWKVILQNTDAVRSMCTTDDGSIWVASGTGLHRYFNGSWVNNKTDDGLLSDNVYKIYEDSQGRLWAGTAKGISRYHSEADKDPPETTISTTLNLNITPPGGEARLAFSGIDKWKFSPKEQLYYSYHMDGSNWSSFTSDTFVSYSNLPAGKHRFEVRAMDRNWNVDPSPAFFEFDVLKPWYHTTAFLLITLFAALSIFFTIGLFISHHIKVENLVKIRTSEIQAINNSLQREIGERKQVEQTLERSEHLYRSAIEVADAVPYYRNYQTNCYEFVGERIEKLIGYKQEEFTPDLWKSITLDTVLMGNFIGMTLEEAVEKARSGEEKNWRADYLIKTRSGESRWIANAAVEVRDAHGYALGTLGILQDITERKRMEKEILEISKIERQRIGDELHDDLCQDLTAIAIISKVLEEKLSAQSYPNVDNAAEITQSINKAINKTRILAKGLHPTSLEAEGLMYSLKELASNAKTLFGIECIFECENSVRIQRNSTAAHLYRITQESLHNAVKHSQGTQVRIKMENQNNKVILSIEDNGIGIQEKTIDRKGMGLKIMEYRARAIGASFSISRNDPQGTKITCAFLNPSME